MNIDLSSSWDFPEIIIFMSDSIINHIVYYQIQWQARSWAT